MLNKNFDYRRLSSGFLEDSRRIRANDVQIPRLAPQVAENKESRDYQI